MVKPGGTGSPALVISATPAPLPPSRSRILALPSEKRYTHFRGDCFTASSRVMSVVCATGLSSLGVLELPAHAQMFEGDRRQVPWRIHRWFLVRRWRERCARRRRKRSHYIRRG